MEEAFFGNGKTSIQLDSKILSMLWKNCVESATAEQDAKGFMELKIDYTAPSKNGFSINIDSYSQSPSYSKK